MIFTWQKGRQESGYEKMTLLRSKLFKFDVYILKYPEASVIKAHFDEVDKVFEHHRLNIVLKSAKKGGVFIYENIIQKGRFHYFRPDIMKHEVSRIEKGTRYVLSIGWLKKKK